MYPIAVPNCSFKIRNHCEILHELLGVSTPQPQTKIGIIRKMTPLYSII